MATSLSTLLSNRASTTAADTPNSPGNERGRIRTINGNVAAAVGDLDASDVILLAGLPTGARVLRIWLANDDLGGTLTVDVGLYEDIGGATAKDADVYATAVDMSTAQAFQDVAHEARGIELHGQTVWEDAGDAADPNGGEYFLGLTVASSTTPAAGDIAFSVEYVVD